jgi:uncharacterized protein YprB with RNaseH-like and TPR domain
MSYQNFKNILFLDIETVPQCSDYSELDERMSKLWEKKALRIRESEDEEVQKTYQKAGIYAEFGKIVCICTGFFHEDNFRIKAFSGDDEKQLLMEFSDMLINFQKRDGSRLCAHNGKEFDFPYICRRMLINGLRIPEIIDTAGKRPWETTFLDTMEMWRFGDYKNYTSLDLLTAIFGIDSPKDAIDGSMVGDYYWNKKDLEAIVTYCKKDVLAIAQLYLKLKGLEQISSENVIFL